MHGFILFLLLSFESASPWGKLGHCIIGKIADSYLHKKTMGELNELLDHSTLGESAFWADEIRHRPEGADTASWHHVDIDPDRGYFKTPHDSNGDLLAALFFMDAKLKNMNHPKGGHISALKFLIHLIGDLHQPFHVGGEYNGGQKIKVKWFEKKINLHSLWDHYLIDHAHLNCEQYTQWINYSSKDERKEWRNGHYLNWAYESLSLHTLIHADGSLGDHYYKKHIQVLHDQLRKAGWRLAYILNQIFTHTSPPGKNEISIKRQMNTLKPFFNSAPHPLFMKP